MIVDLANMTLSDIVKNKKTLIRAKKQTPIFSECAIKTLPKTTLKTEVIKSAGESEDPNRLKVTIVGNTALYCDSHGDVLGVGCYEKTVNEQGANVPHLVDHKHSLEGKIGKTLRLYTEMIDVKQLGVLNSDVETTEVLLMDSEVVKEWNPKIFQLYKDKEVNQHSIGLQYVRIELAANNPDYKEEFEVWNKYYSQVINKDEVNKRGYFWYVSEIKLYEISAVLFGSNDLTPTIETEKSEEIPTPSADTLEEKSEDPTPSSLDTLAKRRTMQLN